MLFPVTEMATKVVKEGNEQKQVPWLVREAWKNGGDSDGYDIVS